VVKTIIIIKLLNHDPDPNLFVPETTCKEYKPDKRGVENYMNKGIIIPIDSSLKARLILGNLLRIFFTVQS